MARVIVFIIANWKDIYALAELILGALNQHPAEVKIEKKKELFCRLKGTCQS